VDGSDGEEIGSGGSSGYGGVAGGPGGAVGGDGVGAAFVAGGGDDVNAVEGGGAGVARPVRVRKSRGPAAMVVAMVISSSVEYSAPGQWRSP